MFLLLQLKEMILKLKLFFNKSGWSVARWSVSSWFLDMTPSVLNWSWSCGGGGRGCNFEVPPCWWVWTSPASSPRAASAWWAYCPRSGAPWSSPWAPGSAPCSPPAGPSHQTKSGILSSVPNPIVDLFWQIWILLFPMAKYEKSVNFQWKTTKIV